MTSADVFQSPPAKPPAAQQQYAMISSSPELPSLAEIAQRHSKRPAPLRSGSNAAPIPAAALTSFTSAKDVLRQAPDVDVEAERSPSPKPKPKAVRKRATKAKPKPEATTAPEPQEPILIPSSPPTDKPARKSRSKKAESAQSTISSRVTKSTTTSKSKSKKKTETVSRHFATTKEKGKAVESIETPQPVESDLHQTDPPRAPDADETEVSAPLEVAMPRRRGWTPPPADGLDNSELLSSSSKAPVSKEIFSNLCQDFARPGEKEPIAKPSAEIAEFMKKRKLNDLPANEQASRSTEASPTQPAAAKKKKKIRTITELATAPYQLPELPDVLLAPGNAETLLKHFDFDGAVKAQADHQRVVMDYQETKSKGKKKAPAKPRKKKAGTAEDPILLSPSSAMKQASNVDFLFGTSSQLQTDEPAEVIRDLQAAIRASNQVNDDEDEDDKSGLWHKGARDVDGSLLEFRVVDSSDGVEEATRGSPSPAPEASSTDNDFPDISIIVLQSQAGLSSVSTTQNTQSQQAVPSSRTTLPSSDKSAMVPPPPPPPSRPATAAKSKRPDFTILTDAQLSRKISTYGFKPMKRRAAMIKLLGQCWDEQQPANAVPTGPTTSNSSSISPNAAATAAPASAPPTTAISPAKKPRGRPKKETVATASTAPVEPASTAPESPKRARGRPRRDSGSQSPAKSKKVTTPVRRGKAAASKVTKIEIADSDDEEVLSVSGGRSSPDPVFSSPPPLDLSISEDAADLSLNLSPTDQESSSFTFITKAVTSAPRSSDPQNPSWHELMLMYTPVVLEDLATWLNAGELTRVGYDAEVSPAQVKQWCESKSVICLWRANGKGGSRKRY
ncbi:AT hook domain-containing protein [Apiospora hydei]|uniref:Structure-specific endonuclease subunit SLX4 n=1 Tax=Apiospora hydei TaxID=1337664 RepID=A0ABR1V1N2_9PEZI